VLLIVYELAGYPALFCSIFTFFRVPISKSTISSRLNPFSIILFAIDCTCRDLNLDEAVFPETSYSSRYGTLKVGNDPYFENKNDPRN
jgi:hypothetical protein